MTCQCDKWSGSSGPTVLYPRLRGLWKVLGKTSLKRGRWGCAEGLVGDSQIGMCVKGSRVSQAEGKPGQVKETGIRRPVRAAGSSSVW